MRVTKEQRIANWYFIGPALFLYVGWLIIPTLRGFYYSLTKFDGLSAPTWVGLKNFITLSRDTELFLLALKNNLILTMVPGILIVSISLMFAFLIHREIRGAGFFRVVFYLPNTLSLVAISFIFMLLYSTTSFGILNGILKFYGATEPFPFTLSRHLVWAVIPIILWGAIGFNTLLYLAAMQRIPETYYEVIKIDGGGRWRCFWHVTIPFIWEIMVTSFIFIVIGGLKIFEPIWLLEGQGAAIAKPESNTIAVLMYRSIMYEYRAGYGTAVGVVLFAMIVVAILVLQKVTKREEFEY